MIVYLKIFICLLIVIANYAIIRYIIRKWCEKIKTEYNWFHIILNMTTSIVIPIISIIIVCLIYIDFPKKIKIPRWL